ncbi:MAG: peptidoglycan DD-metalloendopeptidase family protein [Bacteroidetes bacterium]|nr:peptidoglycan DD-metalloendopeptidase family protein [Bacteroidota bacterium]
MIPTAEHPLFKLDINAETCLELNLSADNPDLKFIDSAEKLGLYIQQKIRQESCLYALGGYGENRKIYSRFEHFDTAGSKRCIHLGIDFWAEAGTPIFCPKAGRVHSFQYNNNLGDYGATLILEHNEEGQTFYSLYGHLALQDIADLKEGQPVKAGDRICHLGEEAENGAWPPHLHFQLILDLEGYKGDYPGVVEKDKAPTYLKNCPDPRTFFFPDTA